MSLTKVVVRELKDERDSERNTICVQWDGYKMNNRAYWINGFMYVR